jgi:hypothetical protein
LVFSDVEGWEKADRAASGADDPEVVVLDAAGNDFLAAGGIVGFALGVADDFDGTHKTDAADVADEGIAGLKSVETLKELLAASLRVFEEALAFDGPENGKGDKADEGLTAKGLGVAAEVGVHGFGTDTGS